MPTNDGYSQVSNELDRIRKSIEHVGAVTEGTAKKTNEIDHTIHAIKISFDNLYQILHEKLEKISGQLTTLEAVPKLMGDIQKTIIGQFELAFLRAFEAQIVSQMAAIMANENRVKALGEFLNEKHLQLEANCKRVADRYDELLDRIAENNKERRRKLDSHVYDLLERIYPEHVDHAFESVAEPYHVFLADHARSTSRARTDTLGEAFARLCEEVKKFRELRDSAYERLDSLLIHDMQEGVHGLSFRVVEVQEIKSGRKSIKLLPPEGFEKLPKAMQETLRGEATARAQKATREKLDPGDVEVLASALRKATDTTDSEVERLKKDCPEWIMGEPGGSHA